MAAHLTLIVGNRNYSSWSLRAYLGMAVSGLDFALDVIPLHHPETRAKLAGRSPSGKMPVLIEDGVAIWDSLAILERLAELAPAAGLLPADGVARAVARSAMAEMHAGFADLRAQYPMNLRRAPKPIPATPGTAADIARILEIWHDCRARFGAAGPFLFGQFTIADAMYAPVCTRLRTYAVPLDAGSAAYVDAVLSHPAMRDWTDAALTETWVIAADEA